MNTIIFDFNTFFLRTGGKRAIQEKKDLNTSFNSHEDDGIHPEDAIDEQQPREIQQKSKKKHIRKELPTYDPRKILSYGFRLNPPTGNEVPVGFMVMPDGTLCAVPIASHMFLPKSEPEVGPKTPEEEPVKEDDGPKTPEIPEELEEGEVSESEEEEPKIEEVDGVPLNEAAPVTDYDEVDGEPFELPTHSVTSDDASSPGSAPSMGSPEVSDEEDPALVARKNVLNWRQNDDFLPAIPVQQYPANAVNTDDTALVRSNGYNAAKAGENGQLLYADDVERPPDSAYSPNSVGSPLSPVKRDSAEEGEIEDVDADKLGNVMKGVAAYVGAFHPEVPVAPVEQSEYDQFYPPGYLNNARPPPPQPSSKPAYITTAPDENRMPHVPRSAPIRPPEPVGYREALPADRRPLFLQGGDRAPEHTRRSSYSMEDPYTPPIDERRPVHRPCRPMSPDDRRYRGGPPSPNAYSRGPYSPDHHYPRSPGPPMHYPRPPVPYSIRPPYDARPLGPGYRHPPPPLGTHRPPYLSNSPPYLDRRDMRRSPSHDRYQDPYHPQYRDKGLPPDPEEPFHYNDHEDDRFPKRHPEHFLGLGPRFITGSGGRCQASFVLSCVGICGVYELVVIVLSVLGRMARLRNQLMVLCSLNPLKLKKEVPNTSVDVKLFVADKSLMKIDIIVCMMNGSRYDPPVPHRPRPPASHDGQPATGVYGPPVPAPGPPPRSSNIFQAYQTREPPPPQQYHQPEASRFGPPIPQQYPSHEQLHQRQPTAEQRYGPPVPASNYGPPMPPVQRSTPVSSYGPPIPVRTHSGYSSGVQTYQKVLPSPEVQAQMMQQASEAANAPTYAQLEQQHQRSSSRTLEEPSDESDVEDSSSGSEYEDKIPNIPIQSYPKMRRPTPEPPAQRPSRFSSVPPQEAPAIQSFPSFPTDAVPFQTYDVKSQAYTGSSPGPPKFTGVVPFDPFRTLPKPDPPFDSSKFKPVATPQESQESALPFASFPSSNKSIYPPHDTSINRIFALYNLDPSDDEKEETRSPPKGPSILQQVFGGQSLPPPVYTPSPERERAPKARRTKSPRPARRTGGPSPVRPAMPVLSRPAPPVIPYPRPMAPIHQIPATPAAAPPAAATPAAAAPTRSRSKSMSISPPKEASGPSRKESSKDPRLRKRSHEDRGTNKKKERRRHERRDKKDQAARETAMRFGRSLSPVDPSKVKAQHDPVLLVKDLRQVLSARKVKNESPKKVETGQSEAPIVIKTPVINQSIMYPFPILGPLPSAAPPAKVATEEEKAAVIARIQKMKEDNEREKQGIQKMQENRAKQKAAIDAKIKENMKLVPSIEADAKSKFFAKSTTATSDPLSSIPTSTATTTTTPVSTTPSTTPTPAANNVVSAMAGLSKDQIKNLKESGAVSITSLPTFLQKAINPNLPTVANVASNVVVDPAGSLIITSTPNQYGNLPMRPPRAGVNVNNFRPRNPNQFQYNHPRFNNNHNMQMRPPGRPSFQPNNNMRPGPNINMSVGQAANMGPMMGPGGPNMGPPGQNMVPPGMGPPGANMWQGPPDFNNGWQQGPPQGQWDPNMGPPPFDPNMGPPPQGPWDPNTGPPLFDPNMGAPGQFMGPPGTNMGPPGTNMGPPGTNMGGPGPNMGVPGPNMGGPGPNMGVPGPNMGGPGPNMGGPGPNMGGPGPNMGGPGPNMGGPGPNMGGPGPNMGGPGGNVWHGPPPIGNFPRPAYSQSNLQPPHLTTGWQGSPPAGPHLTTGWQGSPPAGPTVISAAPQLNNFTDTPAVTEPNKKQSYAERLEAEEEKVKKQIEDIKRNKMMENVKKKSEEIKQQLQARITKTPIAARLGAAKNPGMTSRLGIKVAKVAKVAKVEPKKVETLKPNPSKKSSRFDVPPPFAESMKVTVKFPPNPSSQPKQMLNNNSTPTQLKQILTAQPAPSNINIVPLDEEEELDYNEDIDDLVDHSFGDALEFDL